MRIIRWLFLSIFMISLTGCGISLAADITPPPDYQAPVVEQPVSQATVSPLLPPNLLNGSVIYAAKCEACHGSLGMGDGSQAKDLPVAVAAIGDPDLSNNATPSEWYKIVSEGRIENYMPGFSSLSDREKWDVVAYAFSLSLNKYDINHGEEVFASNCATCHAVDNGNSNPDFTQPEDLSDLSFADMLEIITNGVGMNMSGFGEKLSTDDISDVAAYLRRLGYEGEAETGLMGETTDQTDDQKPPSETESSGEAPLEVFSVTGKVQNLASIPEDLTVTLIGYDGMSQILEIENPVDSDGSYEFLDLDYVENRVYQLVTVLDGIQHFSEVFHNPEVDAKGFVEIPLEIVQSTTDSSSIYAERMHIFFEFMDEETIQVVELLVLQNPSGQVILPADENSPVIEYQLPDNATNLQFEEGTIGDRYLSLPSGFGDMQPFEPGVAVQFLFAYELPYKNKMSVDLVIPVDVEATIVMLPADIGVELNSDLLGYTGDRSMQGVNIQTYSSTQLERGQILELNFSGKYKPSTNISGIETTNTTGIIIGGVFFLLAIIVGFVWYRNKQAAIVDETINEEVIQQDQMSVEETLDAIISLDEAFEHDQIPEEAYQNRRQELIDHIKKLKEEEKES